MQDLGQRLINFLHHYANFDFVTHGVSLQQGYFLREPMISTSPLFVASPFNIQLNLASAAFAMPNVMRMFQHTHDALTKSSVSLVSLPPTLAEHKSWLCRILRNLPDLPCRMTPSIVGQEVNLSNSPRRSPNWDPEPWHSAEDFI